MLATSIAHTLPPQVRVSSSADLNTDVYTLMRSYLLYIERVEGLATATVNNRTYILRNFVRYVRGQGIDSVCDIDIQMIDNYILSRDDLKSSSVGLVKQCIRGFMWYCQHRKKINIGFDYTLIRRKKERPAKARIFTRQEIQQVIKQCENYQDKLMIAVLFETGMRIGELVKLAIEDIRDTEIHVRGKGAKDRTVYITQELANALRTHAIYNRVYFGPIFRHQIRFDHLITDTYTTGTARKRIQRCFEKAGMSPMHPHDVRHSFAIEWLQNGGDIRTLQKILGHESLEVTQVYLQITDNFTQQTYERTFTKSVL